MSRAFHTEDPNRPQPNPGKLRFIEMRCDDLLVPFEPRDDHESI
jgi:hypothetical protein